MLDWLLREEQGALHYPFDVVVGEFSAVGLAGELDALAGQPGTALSIDKRPSEGCGLHLRGDARDVLYKRSWRRLFSFAFGEPSRSVSRSGRRDSNASRGRDGSSEAASDPPAIKRRARATVSGSSPRSASARASGAVAARTRAASAGASARSATRRALRLTFSSAATASPGASRARCPRSRTRIRAESAAACPRPSARGPKGRFGAPARASPSRRYETLAV